MIRGSARRLQAAPVVGSLVVRLRPVVHVGFRLFAALPRRRRITAAWRILLVRSCRRAWESAARYRPLLNEAPKLLSPWQRGQRRLLALFLALPDVYYRRQFARFARRLRSLPRRGADRQRRSGIMMMIGTLGPGGSERQLVATLKALKARGCGPLSLACVNLAGAAERFFLPELQEAGINVATIGSVSCEACDPGVKTALSALPMGLASVAGYASVLAEARPAIAHLWLDEVNIKGGIAALTTGVPRLLLFLRSLPPYHFVFHQPYMREGYRWLARQPGVTLVNNTKAGARAYEAWLGLPEGTIACIHNGFDCTQLRADGAFRGYYRARLGIPPEAPTVGSVFRMTEEKRPLLWLEIAALVRRALPQACFLIVGDGPLRPAMEARAAAADLSGAVYFGGRERDVLGAIADMDLFLLTSRIEGLPNVLIEAQALGVPVVTTPAGGAAEAVLDGLTGVVLASADPDAAAQTVVGLLRDVEWRRRAAHEAKAFVAESFSIERAVDAIASIYEG